MPISLASIKANAKSLIDETNGDYITSTDWDAYVDAAIRELWRMYATNAPDSITTSATFTASPFSIPANVGLRFVQKDPGTTGFYNLSPTSLAGAPHQEGYYRVGDSLYLTPGLTGSFALFYLRAPQTNASGATNLDTILEQFVEYIEVRAALKGASKRDITKPELRERLAQLTQEIEETITRDAGLPTQIIDVDNFDSRLWY